MPVFLVKTIRPKVLRPMKMAEILLEELQRQGDIIVRMYEKTTRTWRHKPEFTVRTKWPPRDRLEVSVTTDDDIFRYLDQGTRVRRAVMSRDWSSKTHVRVIGSRAGRGRMVFVSRKILRPGIEAREFSKEITSRRRTYFYSGMKKAMEKAVRHARD